MDLLTQSEVLHLPKRITTNSGASVIVWWPVLLLVGFTWILLGQATVVGYRWLGELAIAAFLSVALLFVAAGKEHWPFLHFAKAELIGIVLPLVLFTLWSGLSCFWASSWRSSLHHTLLWGCYTIFYVLVRTVFRDKECLSRCLRITGLVVLIISSACVIEFLLSPRTGFVTFVTRYYKNSEVMVSLLPILLVFAINGITSQSARWIVFSLITWFAIVAVASRTIFTAGVASVLMLAGSSIIFHRRSIRVNRWLVFIVLAVGITLGSQWLLKSDQERALFQRFAGTDKTNVQNAHLRVFYWGMAVEGFRSSPIFGIGGDNYFSDYKMLREKYSAEDTKNPTLELTEELIPERAHSEYLQIICELGLVGGLIFASLLAAIGYMAVLALRKRASLITFGALSGITAFLIASAASSYSFRVPANGLCFFFLIAVAASELFKRKQADPGHSEHLKAKPLFLAIGLIVSMSMIGFSAVRALSINHLTNSRNTSNPDKADAEIKKAIALDPSEPIFKWYYGQQLYLSGRYDEAIGQMRLAIEKGLASSPSYFNLLAAEMLAERQEDAARTFSESLRVYPRSVFLRTAHAAFLKRRGDFAAADLEYQKAFSINARQAKSWQLAQDEGLVRLSQVSNTDSEFLHPMELIPYDGALVLSNFQQKW